MYCSHCGAQMDANTAVCPVCGHENPSYFNQQNNQGNNAQQYAQPYDQQYDQSGGQQYNQNYNQPYNQPYNQGYNQPYNPYNQYSPYVQPDAPSAGFGVLGFFFPLVGLILYLVWRDQTPLKAKSAGKGALIGVIASVVCGIVWGVIIALVGIGGEILYY